jgi:hypothetical protein
MPPKEEERGKEKKEEKKKRIKEKKGNRKKENKRRKIEKRFRKFLGKFGEGFLRIFLGFSDTDVNSGMAVMARQTGRRDRGGAGFPSWWPTVALGRHAWAVAQVRAVPVGFAARAPRGKESIGVLNGGK